MNFNLNVTVEEVQIIGAALGKLPYADVKFLIEKLNVQLQEQQPKETEAPEETQDA